LYQDFPDTFLERRYFGGFVPWVFGDIRLARETVWNRLPGYRPAAKSDLPSTPSYRFSPAGRYITYNKTALWLNTMERWLGWPALQRVMSSFFNDFQFKHPTPDDFFSTVNRVSGQDLGWFFDQVYRSSNVFDYGVEDLKSAAEDGGHRTTVTVRRYGEAIFPVAVRVTFEGGDQVTEQWDGRDRWKLYTYSRPARALSAQVDPDRVLLLDVNYTNNSRTLDAHGAAAATKWSAAWMVWLQDCLLSWAMLA
jgi:aminopeptidase N